MSELEVTPDPVVRTALQRLPVPPHEEGFWTRLDEALLDAGASPGPARYDDRKLVVVPEVAAGAPATEGPPPSASEGPDPALALVPPALRRTSNGILLAVAAAAAAVVLLAGVTLMDDRDGSEPASSDELAGPTISSLVDDAQTQGDVPAPMSAASEDASTDAVLAWVDDVGAGETASAWDAMGPTSQAHFASQAQFESELSSIAPAYRAWAASEPEDVIVTTVETSDDETLAVVTLVGIVDEDAGPHRLAEAFPVRLVADHVVLEPFALAGSLEVVVPATDPVEGDAEPVPSGEELVIVVPTGVAAPLLRLDEGETVVCGASEGTELTVLEGSPGQRCAYLPPDGMAAGEHTLTMAFMGSDGDSISAESVLFEAA